MTIAQEVTNLKIILFIISCVLIALTTYQSGKTDAMSSFTGSKDLRLFANTKERGIEKTLSIITYVFVAAFILLSVAI